MRSKCHHDLSKLILFSSKTVSMPLSELDFQFMA